MRERYKVLVHIDEPQRDYVPLHWIGFFLEEKGARVCYSTRRTRRHIWKYWRPHAVLDSHISYHFSEDELKALTRDTLLFLLPAEGLQFCQEHIHVPYTGADNDRAAYLKYVNRIFLWGRWQEYLLEKRQLLPAGLAMVSGNPKYDGIDWYRNKPVRKKSIGLVGLFNGINIFDNRNLLSFIYSLRNRQGINFDGDKEVEDFIWYQVAAFRTFMELAGMLVKRGHTVSLRPHQLENHRNYRPFEKKFGSRFQVNRGGSFQEWLVNQQAIIVMKTTSLYESFLSGVPVITVEDMVRRLDEHMTIPNYRVPELKYCWRPKTFEEACSFADQAGQGKLAVSPEPEALKEKIRSYFDFPRQIPSSREIAENIYNACLKRFSPAEKRKKTLPERFARGISLLDRRYFRYEKEHDLKKVSRDIWEQCIVRRCRQEETNSEEKVSALLSSEHR